MCELLFLIAATCFASENIASEKHKKIFILIPSRKSRSHVGSLEIPVLSRKRNQSFISKVSSFNEPPPLSLRIVSHSSKRHSSSRWSKPHERKSKSRYVRKYPTHRYDRDYVKSAARRKLSFSVSPQHKNSQKQQMFSKTSVRKRKEC